MAGPLQRLTLRALGLQQPVSPEVPADPRHASRAWGGGNHIFSSAHQFLPDRTVPVPVPAKAVSHPASLCHDNQQKSGRHI